MIKNFRFQIKGKRGPIFSFKGCYEFPVVDKEHIHSQKENRKKQDEYPIVFKKAADKFSTGSKE